MDDYAIFKKWYKKNERRFFCAQMNDKEIAFAAFLEGKRLNNLTHAEPDLASPHHDSDKGRKGRQAG